MIMTRILESINYMQNHGVLKRDMICVLDKDKIINECNRLDQVLDIDFDNIETVYGIDVALKKLEPNVLYHVMTKSDYKQLQNIDMQESGIVRVAMNITNAYVKEKEENLMKFLESKGYKPKPTEEYIKGLKRRLKKKGLELVCEETHNQVEIKDNNSNFSVGYAFDIREIKEKK